MYVAGEFFTTNIKVKRNLLARSLSRSGPASATYYVVEDSTKSTQVSSRGRVPRRILAGEKFLPPMYAS